MVLTSNSKGCNLLAWGRGSYGQLGFGTGLPKMPQVPFLTRKTKHETPSICLVLVDNTNTVMLQPLDLASTLPALFGGASITASSPKKQSKPNATAHGESKRPEDSRAQPTEKLDPAKAAALSVSRCGPVGWCSGGSFSDEQFCLCAALLLSSRVTLCSGRGLAPHPSLHLSSTRPSIPFTCEHVVDAIMRFIAALQSR
jgi:hypothetical protein